MATSMAPTTPAAMQQAELMRRYTDFLDADDGKGSLAQRVHSMVEAVSEAGAGTSLNDAPRRLIVSIDSLRSFHAQLATDLLATPVEHLPVFERAMQEFITGEFPDDPIAKQPKKLSEFRIGLEGSFGGRTVSPRGLGAMLVGGVVCVEGIVTRATTIRPRLVVSVHYCPETKKFTDRTYRDATSVSSLAVFTQNAGMPGAAVPSKDEEGNVLETEFGRCWYRDFQRVSVQEMPECSPPGQLPRSVEVFFEGDLCDACKPGDRVRIVGIYRAIGSGGGSGGGSGVFKTVVVANNVMSMSGTDTRSGAGAAIPIHEDDVRNILELRDKGNVFEKLSRSIAPSICGHEYIKKALLLLLVGGKERNLENGTHLRGDINVMMCGDPSTAKSQLLRFVLHTAPLALSTTGRGSSGVGLTAAVTSDPDTNERHLEAGAMVLADRGVVCIDEFDKMSDEDRVAIHEVMEQQTVTIAKAGIHASLNARCSVVAAANPLYGSYDKTRKPHENIALPDSLLSRFDLLFIVLDSSDADRDRLIADHVLKGHRFRKSGHTLDEIDDEADIARPVTGMGGSGGVSVGSDGPVAAGPAPVYETAANYLYAAQASGVTNAATPRRSSRRAAARNEANKILSTDFLKRYINFAKRRDPTLSLQAAEYISESYSLLRQEVDSTKTLPITARCLETLIRLATAHAKCRLEGQSVTREDAEVAVEVLRFALYNQAEPEKSEKAFKRATRRARKKKGASGGGSSGDDSGDSEDGDDSNGAGDRVAEDHDDDEVEDTDRRSPSSRRRTRGSNNRSPANGSSIARSTQRETPSRMLPESAEAEGGAEELDGAETAGDVQKNRRSRRTSRSPQASRNAVVGEAEIRRVMDAISTVRGRRPQLSIDELVKWFDEEDDADEDAEPLTRAQIDGAVLEMQKRELVIVDSGYIFIAW